MEFVEINFDDEIRTLVHLSSPPEAWDGLVMAMRNYCGIETLKFDNTVGVLLSEETRMKSLGSAEISGSALIVDQRGRPMNKDKKKNNKYKSKSGRCIFKSSGAGCWRCVEKGHIQRACKQKKDGEGKSKEKNSVYVTESDISDALILFLAGSSESWVIDSRASFHATSQRNIFQNYAKGELERVYLGDDEPYDIVRKGDMMVRLSNGSTLNLRNARHVRS